MNKKLIRMHATYIVCILFFYALVSCDNSSAKDGTKDSAKNEEPAIPSWASKAIWYQIFVERFHNGDVSNDPTRESLEGAWPDNIPSNWTTTNWTGDWYKPDAWFKDCEDENFYHGIQARRYGGDLIGVAQKLDYLVDLGINAIYFNPLNHAPSLHKYDPTSYHHIDAHFGPNPKGDLKLMETETKDDMSTWVWTSADSLFLSIIEACHEKGIRVIMDYSWNHTGRTFWAFKDVQAKGEASKFKDWYYIQSFDDPATPKNEFEYKSWFGATTLPELKEDLPDGEPEHGVLKAMSGNLHAESLKQHIRDVTKRWMDPNNDGNPSDGVDGFRMDVAAEIPLGFWEEYSAYVKSVNPEAILIGELWWEAWPDRLLDPIPFFEKGFDANMNYRWYRAARRFFAQAGDAYAPTEFVQAIDALYSDMAPAHQYALMNLISGHDSPRVLTSLFNKGKYKMGAGARDNKTYKIHKPDATIYDELKMLLAHQFTFVGAPHVWNGDELGMWGADDPDCRKPLWWPELNFDNESNYLTTASEAFNQPIESNTELLNFYKQMIQIRNAHDVLSVGAFDFIHADDTDETLAYSRYDDKNEIVVCFNRSKQKQQLELPTKFSSQYTTARQSKVFHPKNGKMTLSLEPSAFLILISTP